MEYSINKGIGKPAEFKGLRSHYLFLFAGGLLGAFLALVVLYMLGTNQWICIGFGVSTGSLIIIATFHLNKRYGEHGLMKLQARRRHPVYLSNRKTVSSLLHKKGRAI